jgi:hypothetical protein
MIFPVGGSALVKEKVILYEVERLVDVSVRLIEEETSGPGMDVNIIPVDLPSI